MTIIEYTISTKDKCISCRFYEPIKPDYWPCGNCKSEQTQVKRRERQWNDKACVNYRRINREAER